MVASLVALVSVGGCSSEGPAQDQVVVGNDGPPGVYLAVGGAATNGDDAGGDFPDRLKNSWTQVLYRDSLPRATVFVNLGSTGRPKVADALDLARPEELAIEPTIVTVELGMDDALAGTPVEEYERDLRSLVARLRRGGQARVLVATVPAVDRLPVVERCQRGGRCPLGARPPARDALARAVTGYNAAVGRVAAAEGAEVVDLGGLLDSPDVVAPNGLRLDEDGHRAVADAFGRVFRRA